MLNVKKINLPANGTQIINGSNNLGFEIFKDIENAETDENTNIMYSPLSLNSVLLMAYNGATGSTADEIINILELNGINITDINNTYDTINSIFPIIDKEIILNIANSVWADNNYTIKSDFSSKVQKHYKAEVQNLDFSNSASLNTINNWIKDATNDKITKIVDNLDMNLLLANVLYFKGKWHFEFDKNKTQDKDFYLPDSTKITVPTMEMEDTIKFATAEKYYLVELPYAQGNFVMDLILPQNGNSTDSIINILPNFNQMIDDLTLAEITILLPKFEFYYQSDSLTNIMKRKIPTAFSLSANFSNMINVDSYLDKIIQKTYIKTDEEGTEAVAATGFSLMPTSLPPSYIIFDRPFIFIIREVSTNTIMFIGKVANPSF